MHPTPYHLSVNISALKLSKRLRLPCLLRHLSRSFLERTRYVCLATYDWLLLTRRRQIGDSTKAPGVTHFDSKEDVEALLNAFHSRGYSHIDTARNYSVDAPGSSEARLGQAGAPSRFTIHTKVQSGEPGAHEPAKVALSIGQSLDDLKTSTVETMFLHVPDRQTPFEDTAKAMNDAFQQGKFKKFGLSNYTAAEVKQFIEICEQKGYTKPSVYQGSYNPVTRGGEKELFPLLRKHNMAFFAYR
jgi:aflatoxin B1 aldehyde reductase